MVEILGPLPARPPTPPRPGSRIDESETNTPNKAFAATPNTANSSRVLPSSRGSKQVGWSPYLCTTIELPDPLKPIPKDSPFMRKDHKPKASPFKSILKESNSPIPVWSPPKSETAFNSNSFAMLLESISQQLASESTASRRDAYMQFFNALRAYDRLPTAKDMSDKLNLITDFIQRDVSRDLSNAAPLDTNLANQALKLAAAFVWHSDVAPQLSDDFKIFLVDHATNCLHEAKVPKSVLTHHMSILATQNFGPRVMTNARVTRILTVLQEVSKRVSGKAIALYRLNIYQRLLSQSKSTFVSQSQLWVEHLIFGLLNPMKESRTKAIGLGFQIAATAGPNTAMSNNLRDLCDRPLEKSRKLIDEIRERMTRMMGSSESGAHVPQIWSVIVLLFRSKNWSLDQWEHFKEWVLVLQKCFNCSDSSIKAQAILGWNRFIYAMKPNASTNRNLFKMLGRPIFSQFERRKSDKAGQAPTQLVLSSYYNLIYYTFRPSLPHTHLDLIWEEYIANPTSSTFSSASVLSDIEARVLAHILWSPQARIWTEDRINDVNKIEVEELPSIEPKWVRSRVLTVLKAFESLLKVSVWDDNELSKSNIAFAWTSLANALSLASSKEINPSPETMQAVSSILSLLHRLWNAGPSSLNVPTGATDKFFERFQFLSTTMATAFGSISFTERLLLRASDGSFQTSNTPTHRKSTSGTNLTSPILHLMKIISTTSAPLTPTLSYVRLVEGIIQASCKGRISRGSRLELLQHFAALGRHEEESPASPSRLLEVVWKASARAAADALQSFPMESARERDGSVSRDYDNVTKMLASGLGLHEVLQEWSHLLSSFVRVARTEKGERALPALIIEPLAESLMKIPAQDTFQPSASLLSQSLSIPFLQGNEGDMRTVAQKTAPPPFPKKLSDSIARTLNLAYKDFKATESQGLAGFIESLTSFLGSGAPHFRSQLLEMLQSSLQHWIKDEDSKFDVKNGVDSRLLTACRALTFSIVNVLQASVRDDLSSLQKFEAIICAGLQSSHASRTRKFVDFWHSTAASGDVASSKSSIGKSCKAAVDSLEAAAAKSAEDADNASMSKLSSEQSTRNPSTAGKSKRPQSYMHLNSSPVIGFTDPMALDDTETIDEPQLPSNSQTSMSGNNPVPSFPPSRRDVFQMIDSIRSSSPAANTPGRLGFDTPVHLRRLHQSQSGSGIPLTPTLAPTENEEAFIGSSPTPATRDPTPAVNSDAPIPQAVDAVMNDALDIPSSPPDFSTGSPSPRKDSKRRRNARKKMKKRERARLNAGERSALNSPAISVADDTASDVPEEPKENAPTPRLDERPPSRRTRSALSQSTDNNQNPMTAPELDTPTKPTEVPVQHSKSKSASRKKRSPTKQDAETPKKQHEQPVEQELALSTPVAAEYVDSGDDLDMQIASQLSQDLGMAADQSSQHEEQQLQEEQPTEDDASQSTQTKKRKRSDDDDPQAAKKEKRRSSRFSTAKDTVLVSLETPERSQSRKPDASRASNDTAAAPESPVASTSAPTTRRSTRSSQRKDEPVSLETIASTKSEPGPEQVEPPVLISSSPMRTRKSARVDNKSTPAVSTPPRSTRSTRSRTTRTSQHQTESQGSPLPEPIDVEESLEQQQLLEPESSAPQLTTKQDHHELTQEDVPVSTEEATDSQVTEPAPEDPEMHMEIDTEDPVKTDEPMVVIAQGKPLSTASIQTEPMTAPERDTSETGIVSSLQQLLSDLKQATLSPNALREVDDYLFNIRVEAHDASRRHNSA